MLANHGSSWGNVFQDNSDSDLDESDMFIRHHARGRKRQRHDHNEDGTSYEEPEDELPEEEDESSEEKEGGKNNIYTNIDEKDWKCMKNGRGR